MSYSPWGEHNEALKNPEYQMEGMLDCLREELMMNMPIIAEPVYQEQPSEEPWTKKQWDTVEQLKAQVLHLSNKVNQMRAKASNRKDKRYEPF